MTFSKIKALIPLLFKLAFPLYGFQQADENRIHVVDGSALFDEIGKLPAHIKEASGLEITSPNELWTHNDGGNPMLFCIDTTGRVQKSLQLNHNNSGWEDLTRDDEGNFYVGSFGNNKNDKRELKIYKIPNPSSISEKVYTSKDIIVFNYEDQSAFPPPPSKMNFDADAFLWKSDSLYIFTKNRTKPFTGYTKIYTVPSSGGKHVAHLRDSIYLGGEPMMDKWVTSADISPDGNTIVLLSHQCIWLIDGIQKGKISDGHITRINLGHLSHKAGVTFATNKTLYIVDELEFGVLGGKLYRLDLRKISNLQ